MADREGGTMDVKNLRWVGVQTSNHEAMLSLLRDVLGLRVNFEEPTSIEFSTSDGDECQVMAPSDPYFEFFETHANGPVPLFEVDDVGRAKRELEESGIEVVGEVSHDSTWEWIHSRAPDGNLYELATRLT
jgi:hypothetical protein